MFIRSSAGTLMIFFFFFFSSRRRHTRLTCDWSSDVCSSDLKAKDFFDRGFVIVGSPRTVREQLMNGMKRLRVGHLLALLHFGSMPTDLCKQNIGLFAREVLPHLEGLWEDQYEDRWWPQRLRGKRRADVLAAAS